MKSEPTALATGLDSATGFSTTEVSNIATLCPIVPAASAYGSRMQAPDASVYSSGLQKIAFSFLLTQQIACIYWCQPCYSLEEFGEDNVSTAASLKKSIDDASPVEDKSLTAKPFRDTILLMGTPVERWLHLEKAFVRRVVLLSAAQELSLAEITADQTSLFKPPQAIFPPTDISQEGQRQRRENQSALFPDPQGALGQLRRIRRLEAAIAKVLTEGQVAIYQKEKAAREQFSRDSSALGIALFLDRRLSLTIDQIHGIQIDFAKWSGVLAVNLKPYTGTTTFVPSLNENILLKHLTRTQLDTLSSLRNVGIDSEPADFDPLFDPVLISR